MIHSLRQLQRPHQARIIQLGLCTHYYNTGQHYLGLMDNQYHHCGALCYASEKSNGVFNKCCTSGAIILDPVPPPHAIQRSYYLTKNSITGWTVPAITSLLGHYLYWAQVFSLNTFKQRLDSIRHFFFDYQLRWA